MNKPKIGQDVIIKVANLPALVTGIKYEVVWVDKDGAPCKGIFDKLELDSNQITKPIGFISNHVAKSR